jgi:hypothetical protein|tara:strand:- start:12 stop:557 length:546 start_codon:yes stop_codon:yes gene_type:complete
MQPQYIQQNIEESRQLLHLEPLNEADMEIAVKSIVDRLAVDFYRWHCTNYLHDGPWVQTLNFDTLKKWLRAYKYHHGIQNLSSVLKNIAEHWYKDFKPGPVHAAFFAYCWHDKHEIVHPDGMCHTHFDPNDDTMTMTSVPAEDALATCTCECEGRTFWLLKPSMPNHPNPENIKRQSAGAK